MKTNTFGNSKLEELFNLYNPGLDATPVLAKVKVDPSYKPALRAFWSRLARERLWIGDPGGPKKQGWGYPLPDQVLGLLAEAKIITIADLGPKTSAKSNSCFSVLGLTRSIRSAGYTGPIYVGVKITDPIVWSEILKIVKQETI